MGILFVIDVANDRKSEEIERMTQRLPVILIALAFFVLVAVVPVLAVDNSNYYVVANDIGQGATVYIGEQGLNVTRALNGHTRIGWWASGAPLATPYSQSFDFGTLAGASAFTVSDTFVGYTGNWYTLDPVTNTAVAPAFNVQDPTLLINIWDWDQSSDVTSRSVAQGDNLGFKVSTNMISALDPVHRQPVFNTMAGDGYINIRVKDESGATLTALYNQSAATGGELEPLTSLNVSVSPYFWGIQPGTVVTPGATGNWSTGALNEYDQQAYPIGTYTVYAESLLNNMKNNYKNGGVAYTTKTISQTVTISLVRNIVKIEANKDSVVRGGFFSVTVTGKPSTTYHLWVKNTSDLAGGPDGQPPLATSAQAGVTFDINAGTAEATRAQAVATANSALGYAYANGGAGIVVFDDVSHSADTGFGTRSGFNIVTSANGVRTVEFLTTSWTKPQKYTLHVEQNFVTIGSPSFKIDEVNVTVEPGSSFPPTVTGINPAAGVNSTRVWIWNLAGTNFSYGATAKLNRTGYADITGTSVTVISPSQIECWFDLTNRINGSYNIVVTNLDDLTGVLENGFIVTAPDAGASASDTGVYRPGAGFYLKMDNGSTWNPSTDKYLAWDNAADDLPVAGDWNSDGRTETGVYRPGAGFYLKMNNGSAWNPSTDKYLAWDNAALDRPIAGDWNSDGRTETGVYRHGAGFYLKMDNGSTWNPTTDAYLAWDNAGTDLPVAGDWNSDGRTETGVYRPGAGFYLKMDNGSTWNPTTDVYLAWDNAGTDLPVAGDWNSDGRTETGVYRPGAGFYLKMDNGSTWNPTTDAYLAWDNANGDLPIAGIFV